MIYIIIWFIRYTKLSYGSCQANSDCFNVCSTLNDSQMQIISIKILNLCENINTVPLKNKVKMRHFSIQHWEANCKHAAEFLFLDNLPFQRKE